MEETKAFTDLQERHDLVVSSYRRDLDRFAQIDEENGSLRIELAKLHAHMEKVENEEIELLNKISDLVRKNNELSRLREHWETSDLGEALNRAMLLAKNKVPGRETSLVITKIEEAILWDRERVFRRLNEPAAGAAAIAQSPIK